MSFILTLGKFLQRRQNAKNNPTRKLPRLQYNLLKTSWTLKLKWQLFRPIPDSKSNFLLCFIPLVCMQGAGGKLLGQIANQNFIYEAAMYACLMFWHQQIGLAAFCSTTMSSRWSPWWGLSTDAFSTSIIQCICGCVRFMNIEEKYKKRHLRRC